MEKKVGELTLNELQKFAKVCNKLDCEECPIFNLSISCSSLANLENLDKEVDDETYKIAFNED